MAEKKQCVNGWSFSTKVQNLLHILFKNFYFREVYLKHYNVKNKILFQNFKIKNKGKIKMEVTFQEKDKESYT